MSDRAARSKDAAKVGIGSGISRMPFIDCTALPQREVVPGYRARFLHGEQMTVAYWDVEAGATLPEHAHVHEQIAHVLSGEFELTVAGEPRAALGTPRHALPAWHAACY